MEVILREHVDNLGQRGEVVKVADGYARNYLLPRKLALLATEGNRKQIEREKVKADSMRNPAAHMRVPSDARVPTLIHIHPSSLTACMSAS